MPHRRPGDPLRCDAHRTSTWLGHVICAFDAGGCGAVFKNALTAPLICPDCDHRLLPSTRSPVLDEDNDQRFSGRAMCAHCYGAMKAGTAQVAVATYES